MSRLPIGGTYTTHLILLLGRTAITEVRFTQPYITACLLGPKYLPQDPIQELFLSACVVPLI
jgi:hypothetical protein